MFRKFLRNEKGGAMLMAIMGLAIISIFTLGAIFTGSSNARQTQIERKRTQAYYVADAGAKAFIKHLEELPGNEVKNKLKEMSKKSKEEIKGNYKDWDFTIDVTEIEEGNIYEIKSTGEVVSTGRKDDITRDWTIAKVKLGVSEEKGGKGYEIGGGKIFVTGESEEFYSEFIMQLKGSGISIYTRPEKYGSKVPVQFNEVKNNPSHVSNSGQLNKLFESISSRVGSNATVKKLNEQEEKGYRLEIEEPSDITSKISRDNPIKKESLVRYSKDGSKDKTFEEIKFIYNTQKEDILDYFSKNKLRTNGMSSAEIKKGLESVFLLPVRTEEEYSAYIKGRNIYPDTPIYKLPPGGFNTSNKGLNGNKELNTKKELDLSLQTDVMIPNGLEMNNGGHLILKFSGDTNVIIDGKLEMNDSSKREKLHIYTDSKVNFYINGNVSIDGDLIVYPQSDKAEVNFYLTQRGRQVQMNNNAQIDWVNIYAPNSVVDIENNIKYKGIIVGRKVTIGTGSTFEAPSSGPSSETDNGNIGEDVDMTVEWKR